MRVVHHDPAQRSRGHQLPHGFEIAGGAPILVHGQKSLLCLGDSSEVLRFCERGREWLVDDDVTSGEQGLLRDRMMGRIGRCDDHQIDRPRE